ncbi:prepilin-type N-terminal cleavage/methylation domain-containing protein [Pontiella sp.]|uniref:type IV pilus modification PilV family protein n=1 Tax=Pontiella sp. TaxID=2837462 RepID=UPI003562ACA2
MKQSVASKKGLTLIEVLLAMVILTIGVTSLMTAMSRCLAVVRTARDRNIAQGLILQIDRDHPIEDVDLEELTEEGEFEDYDRYTWFRDIQIVDEEERPGLFLVTLRVQWSEQGREAFEEVMMYRYAPDAESITSEIN